ncbi:MAG: TRAP transporter small permease [Paracoccaceae bacterium]
MMHPVPPRPVRWLDAGFTALAWASAAMATVVMLVTFAGVVSRYVFSDPIRGTFEVIETGMGLIVFAALPLMIRQRGNIAVTILSERFPAALSRVLTPATDLLGAAICAFIAWRIWLQGARMTRYGEMTMELRLPKGMIAQGMSLLMAAAALAFLVCAVEAALRWRRHPGNSGEAL